MKSLTNFTTLSPGQRQSSGAEAEVRERVVLLFGPLRREPPTYKERIKERAEAEHTSESQIIRDALDAYLLAAE